MPELPDLPALAGGESSLARSAVGFCRSLRHEGMSVAVASTITYLQALGALGARGTGDLYWAGRATLVRRPEDIAHYDRAFARYWCGGAEPSPQGGVPGATTEHWAISDGEGGPEEAGEEDHDSSTDQRALLSSTTESLRSKDFALCSEAELVEAMALIRSGPVRLARRSSHRFERARRGPRLDVHRMVRQSMRQGGELPPVRRKARGQRQRRLVLLCDVSGSMEPYARAMLRFAHVLVAGQARVEAFAIGTRLTRLTRQLSRLDPDTAMAAAAAAVADWSGGTRLGEGLAAFNDRFGVRGMARGALVVVLSDGWDRGDPDMLARELARLHRVVHHLVWANPLKGDPRYRPLARGMAAALPHLDSFVAGHDLASLEALLRLLQGEVLEGARREPTGREPTGREPTGREGRSAA